MKALYGQNGELFVGCVEIFFLCKQYIVQCSQHTSKVQYPQTPHNISQYCRQNLWCRFPYSFRLSRAKGNLINDDRGVPSFLLRCTVRYILRCRRTRAEQQGSSSRQPREPVLYCSQDPDFVPDRL